MITAKEANELSNFISDEEFERQLSAVDKAIREKIKENIRTNQNIRFIDLKDELKVHNKVMGRLAELGFTVRKRIASRYEDEEFPCDFYSVFW